MVTRFIKLLINHDDSVGNVKVVVECFNEDHHTSFVMTRLIVINAKAMIIAFVTL